MLFRLMGSLWSFAGARMLVDYLDDEAFLSLFEH